MQVKVNDVELDIFKGARVKDVVLKYSREDYRQVIRGQKVVHDQHGYRLGLGGTVAHDAHLTIMERS